MTSLFASVWELFDTPELAALGPERRMGTLSVAELTARLDGILKALSAAPANHELMLGLVLLWHDHLEESHQIAQQIPSADGSLLHAVMHRREPDYSNAKYWFQRAGTHPCYPALSARARPFLNLQQQQTLHLDAGCWDPSAFVDACQKATREPALVHPLQNVQKTEFQVFLDHLCRTGTTAV